MTIVSESPFVGLRPFDIDDQTRFFGRTREIAALTRAIRSHTFTAVIGASGSGKSSLVRAGVLPELERAGWQYVVTTPGAEPIARLARRLASLAAVGDDPLGETRRYRFDASLRASAFGLAGIVRNLLPDAQGLVLVIDQFEELFRYGEEARGGAAAAMREESRAFVELLLTAGVGSGERLRVVITMRSDYFGSCAAYTGLAEAVSRSQYLVPVPVRDQLEQTIREPLAGSGATIEDALVQRLLVDVEEETDRLPLLQHTLRRLWERASGKPRHLSEKNYAAVGRLSGSIDVKAEAVASQLRNDREHPEDMVALEQVMKALTVLDEHGRATRRLCRRGELLDLLSAGDEGRRSVAARSLDRMLGALQAEDTSFIRLAPGDADVETDIGHEALIRSWKRLAGPHLDFTAGWLREERRDGDRWRRLLEDAGGNSLIMPWEWQRHRRWMATHHLNRVWAERYGGGWAIVQAWGRKRFRLLGGSMVLGATTAAVLIFMLVHDLWQQQAETARQVRAVAITTAGYARGFAEDNARVAALMALSVLPESRSVDDASFVPEAGALLADAMARPIETLRIKVGVDGSDPPFSPDGMGKAMVTSAAFSPDSTRLVIVSSDGMARVWRTDGTGKPVDLKGNLGKATPVTFSSDGTRIIIVSSDGMARVWRADGTGEPVDLKGNQGKATSVTFSSDGTRIIIVSSDGMARVWRADGTGEPVVLDGLKADVTAAPTTSRETESVTDSKNSEGFWSVAFSPDGTRIVTGSASNKAQVWQADGTGKPVAAISLVEAESVTDFKKLKGPAGKVWSVAFSPDGTRIVAGSDDNIARVWLADGTGPPLVLRGHKGAVTSAAFSPDGTQVVTGSSDNTARIWRTDGLGEPLILRGHEGKILAVTISPDGTRVVTVSSDGTARVWRLGGTDTPQVLRAHEEEVRSVAFSLDGTRIVTASVDDTARVWRVDGTGEPLVLRSDGGDVNAAVFSPDGKWIVTALDDQTARVWQADGTGTPRVFRGHEGEVTSVAFSPDGRWIVTGSTDKTARVWQADGTGEPVVLKGHEGWVWSVAFSPDGMRIATSSFDNTARVWQVDGSGEPIVLKGHEDRVMSAAFSPDGTRIVTGSDDNTARVWRADGKGEPLVLRGHGGEVFPVAFSPDGTRIVTGSRDGTIRVWDAVTGQSIGPPKSGDGVPITAVGLSPDGQRFVSGSEDGIVRLWAGGAALAPLKVNALTAEALCPLRPEEREALHLRDARNAEENRPLTPAQRLACGGDQ